MEATVSKEAVRKSYYTPKEGIRIASYGLGLFKP